MNKNINFALFLSAIIVAISCKPSETISYFENGNVHQRGVLIDGKLEGTWKTYYPSGELIAIDTYKNGIKHGICTSYWHPTALDELGGDYKDGPNYDPKTDSYIHEIYNYNEGIMDGLQIVYGNDGTKSMTLYAEKLKDGTFLNYYKTGEKREEGQYLRGRKVGEWKTYFTSGKLRSERTFIEDRKHGLEVSYHKSGQADLTTEYDHGVKTGRQTIHSTTGVLLSERYYKEGKLHGVYTKYNKDGTIKSSFTYRDGSVVK